MFRHLVIAAVICFASEVQLGNGYRILGVFPTPSISHQVVFRELTLALNKRGHELVIVTTDPVKDPALKNYTEIDLSVLYESLVAVDFVKERKRTYWLELVEVFCDTYHHDFLEKIFQHADFRKLYAPQSNETFDLLLFEMFFVPGVLHLAKRFDVPIIGITSLGLSLPNHHVLGNSIMPSHPGHWDLETKISEHPTFWQRLDNFFTAWHHIYWWETHYVGRQQAIARKYFGNEIPDLAEYFKNISLVFVNQQEAISYVRPTSPKIINIGGLHVSKQTISLPEDLQKILDAAKEGFVYMSLGSNAKSTMMYNETLNEFVSAFSRLPYKVLWKFEDDVLPGKPDNVHIMKWVPQQAVLAHPNLKVFIYQGGLQSTEEAVAHAVPLIGFPVLGDQEMQVLKMTSLGVAVKLEITAVNGNELYEAIRTVASDSSYKRRMLELRSMIQDRQLDPLENAVWWTEFVIRHKGAPHLYSSTADDPWYTRQDMDIVAFISIGSFIVLIITSVILYRSLKVIYVWIISSRSVKLKIN